MVVEFANANVFNVVFCLMLCCISNLISLSKIHKYNINYIQRQYESGVLLCISLWVFHILIGLRVIILLNYP